MAQQTTFELKKDNGLEYPARFKGLKFTYTLPTTLDEFRQSRVSTAEGVNADEVILNAINGQGLSLTIQKFIKDTLNDEAYKDRDAEEVRADVEKKAEEFRLGAPRKRGEGKSGKVAAAEAAKAKAEADRDSARATARDMYLALPRTQRAKVRGMILAGGQFTEAELDAMDAEADAG